MEIKKAIKDLQDRVDGEFSIKGIDDCEDMKLGIEALKLVKKSRREAFPLRVPLLPGETED